MKLILIQIMRWMLQADVWRFMGFVSAFVGLLCYALSSSFTHLFGEWNLLKISLYSVFSFIICLTILYTKVWQHSRSLRFKAHSAFLVLTITSVYSFFSDKVMNGKPDAYTLISCAAFAIMSLSLSRQTRCGFELDLMYFFLGCLIVQLMKIKWQLVVAGACFSYSLVIIRSSFSSIEAPLENESLGLGDLHSVAIEVDSPPQPTSNTSTTDIASMMWPLLICMKALQQVDSNLINRLLELLKKFREDKHRLRRNNALVHIDHDFAMDALPSETINGLHEIAKLMVGAGFTEHCCDVYCSWRRGLLQEHLINKLLVSDLQGIEFDVANIHGKVEHVDIMGRYWVTAPEVAVWILFPIEWRLCDRVFSGFPSIAARCFMEICQGETFQLLKSANAIANGSPSAWHLFRMLPIFETLCHLISQFQSLFPDSLVNEAIVVKNRLGEASRDIFMDLHKLIFQVPEAWQVAPADGQHHPMTVRVMNYVASACRSRWTLELILHEYPKVANGVEASSSFIAQMERIMMLLERKLIEKSKNYEDPALCYLFMVNNRRHIEAINRTWEMRTILGDDWLHRNQTQIRP